MKTPSKPRFLLLQVIDPHYHQDVALGNMHELEQLVATYGGEVVEKSVQHKVNPNPNTYIGGGKLEWVKTVVADKKIDAVVLNDIVNSGQLFRLEKALWEINPQIKVWDRVDLILNIFDLHAQTIEAKLQIELARIQHTGPRIYGLGGTVLSRQGGGIGTRGMGETNIEIERRQMKNRKLKIQDQLKRLAEQRQQRIKLRQEKGIRSIALVGYTSAGKTTLFNALTQKTKQTNRSLFTTLDTVVGKLALPPTYSQVLLSDTIGFIEDLPPFLIDAFRSTLMESVEADVILHIINAADPEFREKIKVVDRILADLNIHQTPVLVFNQIDLLERKDVDRLSQAYNGIAPVFISAKTGTGLDTLKLRLSHQLFPAIST